MLNDKEFTPREIEVFAAVMLHGTTTKAADSLDITQPAVSKMLMQFTKKAGFPIFKKSRQRLMPTPEAHMLYAEVQRVYESARGITRIARDILELRGGRLEICALPAFGLTLLPTIIAGFSRLHPQISIALDIRSSVTVIQRASRSQLDIGIGATLADENPSITRQRFASTPPVCVIPVGHPLADCDVVRVADLGGVDFISLGSADPMRRQLDLLCEHHGVIRNMTLEANQSSTCISLAAAGAGVAMVDRLSAWMARDMPIVIRDFQPRLEVSLSIYRPWGVITSKIADTFTDYLIQSTRSYMKSVDEGIDTLATVQG